MGYTYLLAVSAVAAVAIFIQYSYELTLFRTTKEAIMTIGIPALLTLAVNWTSVYLNLYAYTSSNNLGITIFNLPIEAYMVAILGPYFVMVVNAYSKKARKAKK